MLYTLFAINKSQFPDVIGEQIKEFIFINAQKRMQSFLLLHITKIGFFSRIKIEYETLEEWAIDLNYIQHQSTSCGICGNFKNATFSSNHSKREIEYNIELKEDYGMYFDHYSLVDKHIVEECLLLYKTKILCDCNRPEFISEFLRLNNEFSLEDYYDTGDNYDDRNIYDEEDEDEDEYEERRRRSNSFEGGYEYDPEY